MEYDSAYSGLLLSSFNEMREAGLMCDFTVKVGDAAFQVHRLVLAAASKYFTAMFSSKLIEVQQKFVDMKSLNSLGVRKCIDYLYTGGVKLDRESVEHTLEASSLMQLDGLTSICFKFLGDDLSVETCLSAVELSSLYAHDDISKLADKYVIKNFEAVISTEMFPHISKSDLWHYIEASNAEYDVKWQAVIRWFSVARAESGKILFEVMKSINLPKFPFQFLLKTVLNDQLLKENDSCIKLVIEPLFSDADLMKSNLCTENFFAIRNITKLHYIPNSEKINGVLNEYLEENFEKLFEQNGFDKLEEIEIVSLLQSTNIKYSTEKIRWLAALKWTKYDEHHRKKVFVKLFKLIEWKKIPKDFIHQTVLQETLVDKSHECKNILLGMSLARDGRKCLIDKQTVASHIACLDIRNGNIKALNLTTNQLKDLPAVLNFGSRFFLRKQRQVVSIENDIYCLDFEKVSRFDQNAMKWIQKQSRKNSPTEFCEVATFQKHIYVLDRDAMACYHVADDIWAENLPGCRLDGSFCAALSYKFIYAMGGRRNKKRIADVKRFDSTNRSWSEVAPMNTPRSRASGAVFNEKVFVIGGRSDKESLNSVEFYNPLVNKWTYVKSMLVARWNLTTCVANNQLYVVGGEGDEKSDSLTRNSVEVYDEATDDWKIVKKYYWVSGFTPCCAINLYFEKDNDGESVDFPDHRSCFYV